MPGSATSLGSLSSPSPSPSPPPTGSTGQPEIASNGLGTDSELSELTEEEQETEKQKSKKPKRRTLAWRAPRGAFTSRGRGRKRGTLVPPAMWEWVSKPSEEEEEEEEEVAGPPRVMEEEEDEDESRTPRSSAPQRSSHNSNVLDDEGEPEVDVDGPQDEENDPEYTAARANNDESESGEDDDAPARRSRTRLIRRPAAKSDNKESGDESSATEDDVNVPNQDQEGEEEAEEDDATMSDGHPQAADVESEDETEPEAAPVKGALLDQDTTAHDSKKSVAPPMVNGDMDIDATAPPPESVTPPVAAAAASLIPTSSTPVDPQSPPSSAAGTPASSRSPSPTPPRGRSPPQEVQDVNETSEQDGKVLENGINDSIDSTPSMKHIPPPLDLSRVVPNAVEPEVDQDVDVEPDADQDRSAEDIDVDEPSPDGDLEAELESDLQPAHRAEALDVLAMIELKFAMLRERLYVEKMEALTWEEALVMNGAHPELIHLQTELSRRRDKRLELASRKQEYEITSITKRRKLDEDATWSWWKVARDDLQTDMISETNRRRRKLERDRKALERPQPIRRIPQPLQDVPPPPSLRQIAKTFPHTQRRDKHGSAFPGPLYYPEVTSLTSAEVSSDIEMIYQHRRAAHEPFRMLSDPQMAYRAAFDQPSDALGISSFGSRIPPIEPMQHQLNFPGSEAGPGRMAHLHYAPPHPHSYNGPEIGGPGQLPVHGSFLGSNHANGDYVGHTGRRSISPVTLLPNGVGSAKQNGVWGPGMNSTVAGIPKAGEWAGDLTRREIGANDDDEDRIRSHRRDRDKRDKDRERDQENDAHKEQFTSYSHQGAQSRSSTSHPPHQHVHAHPNQLSHHHAGPHHHHHHHHHVHHHHHNPPPPNPSSIMPATSDLSSSHIPAREYDANRPQSGPVHPTEVINLSSSKPMPSHWKNEDTQDYRDGRSKVSRPGPPQPDERDRPLAMPFVLGSSHSMHQSHPPNAPVNATQSPRGSWNDDASLRLPPPSSASPLGHQEARPHSPGPSRYSSAPTHVNRGPPPPPLPALNKPTSLGLSPPRTRSIPQSPSISSAHPTNSIQSPPRFGPPPSGLSPSLKIPRPGSPPSLPPTKAPPAAAGGNVGSSNSSVYSPRLVGPGRTSTPTGLNSAADSKLPSGNGNIYSGSRTASPLTGGLPYQSPSMHPSLPPPLPSRSLSNMNGILGDRERDREKERDWDRDRERHIPSPRSPILPATKMKVAQIVDGH